MNKGWEIFIMSLTVLLSILLVIGILCSGHWQAGRIMLGDLIFYETRNLQGGWGAPAYNPMTRGLVIAKMGTQIKILRDNDQIEWIDVMPLSTRIIKIKRCR